MSLGLMMCMELEYMRFAELGRREAESVAGGGEELTTTVSTATNMRPEGAVDLHDPPRRPDRLGVR